MFNIGDYVTRNSYNNDIEKSKTYDIIPSYEALPSKTTKENTKNMIGAIKKIQKYGFFMQTKMIVGIMKINNEITNTRNNIIWLRSAIAIPPFLPLNFIFSPTFLFDLLLRSHFR